ncbi:MAG: FecR domain-containing protein [Leptolyngbya sp. SIO1E4]|nr:FecR domain-containing protein [Leptolyngbya sp. SIO1E4]
MERYLALRSMSGSVTFRNSRTSRTARVGDRLQSVGDGLTTSQSATARLEVDTGVGFINVSENTRLRIQRMDIAPDNGRITHLEVPQGQVRLQLRSFTHEGSELEIQTPAGVSSVRGTEFGVSVQPDGKMGVATLTGAVATSAQDQTVEVPGGFQNLTVPGQPPSPPTPLQDNPELTYEIVRSIEGGNRRLQLVGQVDPVNLVLVEEEPQTVDTNGRFTLEFLPVLGTRVQITVITPLGQRRDYDLAVL